MPCPLPGDLPNPGIEPRSLKLQADSLPSEPLGKPQRASDCIRLELRRASLVAQLVKNPPAIQETPVQFLGQEDSVEKGYPLQYSWVSLVAQTVKNPLAMWETWFRSLGWEDPLE